MFSSEVSCNLQKEQGAFLNLMINRHDVISIFHLVESLLCETPTAHWQFYSYTSSETNASQMTPVNSHQITDRMQMLLLKTILC